MSKDQMNWIKNEAGAAMLLSLIPISVMMICLAYIYRHFWTSIQALRMVYDYLAGFIKHPESVDRSQVGQALELGTDVLAVFMMGVCIIVILGCVLAIFRLIVQLARTRR